jgi:hypothetical protein
MSFHLLLIFVSLIMHVKFLLYILNCGVPSVVVTQQTEEVLTWELKISKLLTMSTYLLKNISWEAKIWKVLTVVFLQIPVLWDISVLLTNTVHLKRLESSSLDIHFHLTVCIVKFADCNCLIWMQVQQFCCILWLTHTNLLFKSHQTFSWKCLQSNNQSSVLSCFCMLTYSNRTCCMYL